MGDKIIDLFDCKEMQKQLSIVVLLLKVIQLAAQEKFMLKQILF